VLAAIAAAQPLAPADRERAQAAAFEVMKAARYATLVTVGRDGHPQARVVDPLLGADRTIWIATNPLSRKVEEIRRDARVTLLFFNAAANEYVTVHGRARAAMDAATRAARWKPEWDGFYKKRYEGADFLLIQVEPLRLELSSPRLGFANDDTTWKPVIVDVGGK
jgi:general stress protein 26